MRVLYLKSNLLQIVWLPLSLQEMGHDVGIYSVSAEDLDQREKQRERFVRFTADNGVEVLISNVFCACAAEYAKDRKIPYIVYSMDAPEYRAWRKEARYEHVYLFRFDSRECEELRKRGYRNVWYMPLVARNTDGFVITDQEIRKYQAEISFVGSLYTGNAYDALSGELPSVITEHVMEWVEESAFRWDGEERIAAALEKEVSQNPCWEALYHRLCSSDPEIQVDQTYLLRQFLVNRKLTQVERSMVMELLADMYDFRLYTWDEEKVSPKIRRFGAVDADTEALKVFYASKINLNLTLRSIESGLPLRLFDIMSVGGFVLTDYRVDAPELFEEDKEIVMYRSPEELLDKAAYYLKHEKERVQIGYNAYRKVQAEYSYQTQLAKIWKIVFG